MKKILIVVAGIFIVIAIIAIACSKDDLTGCKKCRLDTYENGALKTQGDAVQYCGTELISTENTPPVTVGSTTTKYDCE